MAVIDKTSSWYSLRGKVGGLSVSSNAQGSYVRALRPPNASQTPGQTQQRQVWAQLYGLWQGTSAANRANWNAAAAGAGFVRYDWYGQPYHMSGLNLFVSINRTMWAAFASVQITPPAAPAPAAAPASTFVLRSYQHANGSTWATAGAWDASIAALRLDGHASYLGTQLTSTQKSKFIVYWLRAIGSPLDIASFLNSAFGHMPLQYTCFFNVTPISAEGRHGTSVSYTQVSLGV